MSNSVANSPAEFPADAPERTRAGRTYRPHVDLIERENELLLVADVPGANPEEIEVRFEGGELSIDAPAPARQPDDTRYLVREYGVGNFHRTFQVSEQIDAAGITAACRNGVLTLHLPKAESSKPRKIRVVSD